MTRERDEWMEEERRESEVAAAVVVASVTAIVVVSPVFVVSAGTTVRIAPVPVTVVPFAAAAVDSRASDRDRRCEPSVVTGAAYPGVSERARLREVLGCCPEAEAENKRDASLPVGVDASLMYDPGLTRGPGLTRADSGLFCTGTANASPGDVCGVRKMGLSCEHGLRAVDVISGESKSSRYSVSSSATVTVLRRGKTSLPVLGSSTTVAPEAPESASASDCER